MSGRLIMTRHDTDEDKRQVTAEGTWREGSASWWEAVAIKRAGAIKDLEQQLASSKAENGRLARGLQSQQTSHERFRQLEQQLAAANTRIAELENELRRADNTYLKCGHDPERIAQLEQQLAAANTDRKFLEKELHNAEEQLVVRHPQYDAVSGQLKAATEKLAKALALNDSWCAKCPYIIDSADCARNDCHEHEMRKLLRGDA